MKLNRSKYPLVRLPEKTDLVLFLIKQELKANKFFNTLVEMGGGDFYYRPCLDSAILSYSGFQDYPDDTCWIFMWKE